MVFVVATVVLVAIQSRVSLVYEGVAKQVGVYDQQVHALNAVYLDYEEQSAIMRSSNFLLQEHGGQFASASEKVLYVEPGQAVLSQQ